MKKQLFLLGVLFVLFPALLLGQGQRWLRGEVIIIGQDDERIPVTNTMVTIKETGNSDKTDPNGLFRIFLPEIFKAGAKVTLIVDKAGWQIQYPLDGEALIPAEPNKKLVVVRLLRLGSKLF